MKPVAFNYLAPDSLEEALEIKGEYGDEVKPLAGGQSLIPAMNFRVAQPTALVDLNKIEELNYIRDDQGGIAVGAMTRQSAIEKSALVEENAPLIHDTMPFIAHPQIRNRGTFGGSLAHADPASELPVLGIALDARFKAEKKGDERWIEAKDFFLGFFEIALTPDELLTDITFPKFPTCTGWSFHEISRRRGDYAMAGVAALISLDTSGKCEKARLVYLNVGDRPVDAVQAAESIQGKKVNNRTIGSAAAIAAEKEIAPFGNLHATPEYQRHLSKVLTVRALNEAHGRAQARTHKS